MEFRRINLFAGNSSFAIWGYSYVVHLGFSLLADVNSKATMVGYGFVHAHQSDAAEFAACCQHETTHSNCTSEPAHACEASPVTRFSLPVMAPRFSQLLPSVDSLMDLPHRPDCRVKTFTLRA